jgi:hypothetical protein
VSKKIKQLIMKKKIQIPQKKAAYKAILLSLWMLLYASSLLIAQQGTLAVGGVGTGAGGTVTYSTGLVSYITATGGSGKINQGLQQPNTATGKFIPGKIEAESFDAKLGPQFATATTDVGGGQHVAGLTNGSWLDYNVTVTQTGNYTVNFRIATTQNNAQFQVKLGATVLGAINIPNTGGWDVWQTVALTNIPLTAGLKTIRIQLNSNETCNFNWTDWTLTGANTAPTANAGPPQTIVSPPTTQVTLNGSGTANNGGSIIGYAWTQIGGTAATIASPSSASTLVTGLTTPGARTFHLVVTQNDLQTAFSDVVITVNPASGKFIPGRIEAESWDAKLGPQFATATTDVGGGQHVAGLTNGSWLDYNVTVTQTGNYTVNFRIATTQNNTQFQVKLGATVLGAINIPNTGGWDVWQTVALTNIPLTAGLKTIRIQLNSNETCNFNWTDWTLTGANTAPTANAGPPQTIVSPPTTQVTLNGSGIANNGGSIIGYAWTQIGGTAATIVSPSSASTLVTGLTTPGARTFHLVVTQNDLQTAFSDVVITVNPATGKFIPGRIEAESWDAKLGPQFAIASTDVGGGQIVVGITNGSWLDYNVNVLSTGAYTVSFRIATTQNNAQFQLKLGATVLGTINIPNTGGWSNWQTVSVSNISLTAGVQTIRIQSSSNESCNFNWTDWVLTPPAPVTLVNKDSDVSASAQTTISKSKLVVSVFPNPAETYFTLKAMSKSMEIVRIKIIDIAGRRVQLLQANPGQLIRIGENMKNGTYFVEVVQGNERVMTKIIKQ